MRDSDELEDPALGLAPMIDVVFLLLIFFMVATTFLDPEKELGIELPEAQAAERAERELEELVINLFQDGRVSVSGSDVDPAGLQALLVGAARRDPATPVVIRGDRLVAHERVVGVMDACQGAGLRNLAVGTLDR